MQKFTVTEFVDFLNSVLTAAVFPEGVIVEGEVAEYRLAQGKWIWFLLKDGDSVVSCFATTWKLRQPLEDGMQVRVYGSPKVHNKSGKFSLVVEQVEPIGEGALRRAYELLKKALEQEGLFAPARKRSLPRFPQCIGLIASRESAAYSDFLRILGNRWGGIEINSIHVQVQGSGAVESIVAAFDYFNHHSELADVIVLTRGGGSLEDLRAFNSEAVARAVFGSLAPVVVGVGHERDESLADFVADVRASTPSNAAEILVPDRFEFLVRLQNMAGRLATSMESALIWRQHKVDAVVQRIELAVSSSLSSFRHRWRDLVDVFQNFSVRVIKLTDQQRVQTEKLLAMTNGWLSRLSNDFSSKERMLAGFDPNRVLRRGYAIVRCSGQVIKEAAALSIGSSVEVQLDRGSFSAEVTANKIQE